MRLLFAQPIWTQDAKACPTSLMGVAQQMSTHGVWAQQLSRVRGLDTGAGLDGCLCDTPGWQGHCPALRCRRVWRASVPEAGRVEIGHSPHLGLHPQDPDLEGGPGCAEAQPSLKRFSLCLLTKSPPQPYLLASPAQQPLGLQETLCKGI